jgi:hypothetical protein
LPADGELRIGQGEEAAQFEGELGGVFAGIDRTFALGVANGPLELADELLLDLNRTVTHWARAHRHLGGD